MHPRCIGASHLVERIHHLPFLLISSDDIRRQIHRVNDQHQHLWSGVPGKFLKYIFLNRLELQTISPSHELCLTITDIRFDLICSFWNVSFMLVYHHIWNHSHQLLPSSLHIGSFIPLKLPFFVSKMIFFLHLINKKFQPWYFSICLQLLIRLIIKFSCPGYPLFMVSPTRHWI